MAECPSRFSLARLAADDLDPAEREAVSGHVQRCSACRQQLAEIEKNAETYASREEEHLARLRARLAIEERRQPARPRWLRLAPALGGLAAAAAVVLVVVPRFIEPEAEIEPASTDIRFKGSMAFEIVARRGEHQFRVKPGMELRADDALRFVVTTGSSGYLSVFSIDAGNRVSPFYPDSDPAADREPLTLDGAGRHELPGSVILDRAAGDECFVVAFSEKSFDRSRVHERALRSSWYRQRRQPGKEESGPDLQLGVIWVKKGP